MGVLPLLALVVAPSPAVAGRARAAESTAESLATFPPPSVRAWQTGLLRPDRMEHAGLAFALTAGLIVATRDARAAAGTALALGVVKELWDRRAGSAFDGLDLAADATGIAVAVVCVRARGP